MSSETIAAIATASGIGGIGIVRVSGPEAFIIAERLTGAKPSPRSIQLSCFRALTDTTEEIIDEGLVLSFEGPHSFTGEDVVEFHGHGGPVVMDALLEEVLKCGARQARAGEFSERAFINGKLDLVQAESIADLIESGSREAARNAVRSLQGVFSDKINGLLETLTSLRVYVEAAIDFPEEEVDFLNDDKISFSLSQLATQLRDIQNSARQGVLLREGLQVVIAGSPNAGKSSLLNLLAQRDSAIVTPIPGTTRDTLREYIAVDGLPIHIVDTAGLRESDDEIEMEGVRRAKKEIADTDHLLLVIDSTLSQQAIRQELATHLSNISMPESLTVILNKTDMSKIPTGLSTCNNHTAVCLSAQTGEGLEALHRRLKESAGLRISTESGFTARRRHIDALFRTLSSIQKASELLEERTYPELVAEELRLAQQALGEITGSFSSDDLLGEIFSSFCIGK